MDSSSSTSTSSTSTATNKDKEPFKVRAELFAPTRLAPKAYALFRVRSLITNVIAHECLLLVLLAAKTIMTAQSLSDPSSSTIQLPHVGILGGGHIGTAVVMALLRSQYPSDKIAISTRQPERTPKCEALVQNATTSQSHLVQYHSIAKYYDNARLSRESDVLVLCMPPSQLKSVTIQIKHALCVSEQPTLVVSVLCGAFRELLQKSIGSKLVTRTTVNVARLKGRREDDHDTDDDEDLKDEDDGNAAAAEPVAGVGNGSGGRVDSVVEIAARELAREQEDVESLLQVLTDLSLRLQGQQQQNDNRDDDGPAALQEDAARHARCVLFGDFDHQEDEDHHPLTAINPHRTGRKQDREQLRLRPEREARGGWRSTAWDELLAVVQHVMRVKRNDRSISIGHAGKWSAAKR